MHKNEENLPVESDASAESKALVKVKVPIFRTLSAEIPIDVKDIHLWKRVSLFQLIYSVAGLVLGLTCVIFGVLLFLNGIGGSVNWTAKFLGASSEVSDAAPGVILFIVGLFVIYITRFKVKVKK